VTTYFFKRWNVVQLRRSLETALVSSAALLTVLTVADSAWCDEPNQTDKSVDETGQKESRPADAAKPEAVKPDSAKPDNAKPDAASSVLPAAQAIAHLRTAEMRLSGSMCMACLKELENRLKELQGVAKVKIEYPFQKYYEYYLAPTMNQTARAVITYDSNLTSMPDIKAFMRIQGYHPYKIVEKDK